MPNRVYGLLMCTAFVGALVSSAYVPQYHPQFYIFQSGLLAAWVLSDALDRNVKFTSALGWSLMSFVLCPLVVPRWCAVRPLKPGECRKGGREANFFAAFCWVTLMYTGVSAALNFLTFGPEHGFELIINSGFAVAGLAYVMALTCRKDSVLEMGPRPQAIKVKDDETH